eukprot:superscaffoldBa00000241_g3044
MRMILRFHYYGTLQLTLNRRTAALLSFGCGAYGEPIHAPKPQSATNPMTEEADLWLHSHTWFHYALVKRLRLLQTRRCRRGRHVPSCRLVTDPNDPSYPVKTGLLTGLAPPVMPARSKLSAHGVREEPRFVTARAGESVILGCDVSPPLDGQQPPYVVEWFKFGVPIPFFINFRFYPPHVDPEYTGPQIPDFEMQVPNLALGLRHVAWISATGGNMYRSVRGH